MMKNLSSALVALTVISLNIAPVQAANKQLEATLESSFNVEQSPIEQINNDGSYRYCFRFTFGRIWCI